jgi:putative hydrolase of the HAD superfamily
MNYVFDIDDTLYLERDYVRSGFAAVSAWLSQNKNFEGFGEKAWSLFEAGVRGRIFDEVLSELGVLDVNLIQKLVQIYRNHMPDIKLEFDVYEFFEQVEKVRLFVITDGHSSGQWQKINALGISPYFSKIIVTDDLGKAYWKPSPKAFQLVQGDSSPKDYVYIADNPNKDFRAPAELGWHSSFRIRRKGSLHYEVKTPSDCIEVESLSQILKDQIVTQRR